MYQSQRKLLHRARQEGWAPAATLPQPKPRCYHRARFDAADAAI